MWHLLAFSVLSGLERREAGTRRPFWRGGMLVTSETRGECDAHGERKRRLKAAARLLAIGALRMLQRELPIVGSTGDDDSSQDRNEQPNTQSGSGPDGGSQ